jgi:hypothetical protein
LIHLIREVACPVRAEFIEAPKLTPAQAEFTEAEAPSPAHPEVSKE